MTNKEALNAITAFVENYACGSDLDGLREAIEALKERPHGKIVKDEKGYPMCSRCGEKTSFWNFCPRCGADMREGVPE